MEPLLKRLIQKGSPFELMDAVVKGIPCKIFHHGPKTLQDVFLKAIAFKQNEFIISGETRLSFGQTLEQASHFASVLMGKYNVVKGERVAILMDNSPEWVIAFIAIYFAGAAAVTIHADTEKKVTLKALEITGCSLILSDGYNVNKLDNNYIEYTVILFSKNPDEVRNELSEKNRNLNLFFLDLAEVPDNNTIPCNNGDPKPAPDDEALISFTSGTTGAPKGVVLSHRNMTTGLMNMMLSGYMMSYRTPKRGADKQANTSNMQPCSLLLSPFSHIGGYSQIMLMCYLGGKIVLMNEWDTCNAATLIEKEQARSLSGATPVMIRKLLRADRTKGKLKTLTNLNIHGSVLNQRFLKEVADEFPSMNVGTGYGMTETCGSISTLSGTEVLNNPNWIGPVLPSVYIKVVDESGKQQSQENLGEICVRGAMVMKEYCADPDNTNAVLKDGWLKTGDLGYLDIAGKLYVTDRIKDVIICNNHNISAGELERMASDHSMVDEAVVFGVPSSERCERIVLVILTNNMFHIEELNLKQELSSRINKHSDNMKIILVDSLPRTVSGKVNRNELRKQVLVRL